ncbi:MAG: 23S rRNA (uracil(1939)-C(5))-methyltransferase RlmD [Chromatiales bacterium]|nr:MAG: 23S rRNA (uracil(1939)-C(5))-methyltransferase RlmD [Chromatiales bacterium]
MAAKAEDLLQGRVVDTTAEGRGVIRGAGKTVFLDGAIAGELVRYRIRKRRRNYDEAELVAVLEASADRVEPRCAVFGTCGGCALQHIEAGAQLRLKEAVLLDNLQRIGGVQPARVLPPISGPPWGYRRKARLGVKYVAKKGRVLVGFRERHAPYVTDTARCETLHPSVGERLSDLADLIGSLTLRERLPQIEVGVGDAGAALVCRVLDAPTPGDLDKLRAFARETALSVFLQPGGADTIVPLPGAPVPDALRYRLPAADIDIEFRPTDFIQVNQAVNQQMVARALELLAPAADSRVLDLYCGLGNFTLALARRAAHVTGVEGSDAMVEQANANAALNGLKNVSYRVADLAGTDALDGLAGETFDRVLLDPPRSGAAGVLDALARFAPARIVYVSCHPGTLARDVQRLTGEFGYRLDAAGIMDMFPQTAHVEAMALLTGETAHGD